MWVDTEYSVFEVSTKPGSSPKRTFTSLARGDGARPDVVHWAVWGPTASIMDVYTTLPWPSICAEISKLKVELRPKQLGPLAPRTVDDRNCPPGFLPFDDMQEAARDREQSVHRHARAREAIGGHDHEATRQQIGRRNEEGALAHPSRSTTRIVMRPAGNLVPGVGVTAALAEVQPVAVTLR